MGRLHACGYGCVLGGGAVLIIVMYKIVTKFLFVISNQVLFCLAYFKINACIIDKCDAITESCEDIYYQNPDTRSSQQKFIAEVSTPEILTDDQTFQSE